MCGSWKAIGREPAPIESRSGHEWYHLDEVRGGYALAALFFTGYERPQSLRSKV